MDERVTPEREVRILRELQVEPFMIQYLIYLREKEESSQKWR